MPTALVTHSDCLKHLTPEGHPERIERLQYILEALDEIDLRREEAPLATDKDILRIHPIEHLERIQSSRPETGFKPIDADTFMSPGSLQAAYRAAGGVLKAVDMVLRREVTNTFVAVRPPGHHAETTTAMGFCFFGNVALGAKYALDFHNLSRVAIVDFDVHHGNGTQDILWNEKRTLTITSQQMPLWPGTGGIDEKGSFDNVVNVPLPPNSDGNHMRAQYQEKVFPKLEEFNPELILISAGFDAHRFDPLAQLLWETEDFVWLTREICKIALRCCDGKLVSVLEGGYNLNALAEAVRAHVLELKGVKNE